MQNQTIKDAKTIREDLVETQVAGTSKAETSLVDPVIEHVFIQYFFVFPNSNLTLGDYYD